MRTVVLVPEALVMGSALALLLAGPLRLPPAWRRPGALAAAVAALGTELWLGAATGTLFGGGWAQDRFALFAKAALLLALVVLAATAPEAGPAADAEPDRPALPLAFLAAFGGMVAASATSLVGLWAGLELASLAAVAAAGLAARETGMRLLLVSAVAGALVAIGFAILYAMAGGASLAALQAAFHTGATSLPLAIAVLLTLAGIVVRLGLAPFHWATVEGSAAVAPTAAAALGGLLVATAAIAAARLLGGLGAVNPAWAPWLVALAAFTMLAGGLRAAAATAPRALVAWLVVAQAGWVAAGLAAHDRRGSAAALLLLGALLLAAVAAPALAAGEGAAPRLAGLGRTEPARAAGLSLVLLSLAGTPPLAGFFGEFAVAAELVRSNLAWALAAGLLGSLLALTGVLRSIRAMYLESADQPRAGRPARPGGRPGRVREVPAWALGPLVAAVVVLAYGILANPISGLAVQGAAALRLP